MPLIASNRSSLAAPIIALITTAAIGSIMGIFARELAKDMNVSEQVALRSSMGALILYAFFFRNIRFVRIAAAPRRDIILAVMRAIFMFAIAIGLGTVAYVHGNYSAVAVIMALPAPAFLSVVIFGERLSLREGLLIGLAFVGAAIVIMSGHSTSLNADWPLLAAIGATVFMSLGILARKQQSDFLNALETTFLMLVTAAVSMGLVSVFWMAWSGNWPHVSNRSLSVAAIAGGANIAFLMLTHYAIPRVKGVVINNLLGLQPLFGTVIGFAFFHETMTAIEWLGCLLILAAVVLIANPRLGSGLISPSEQGE